MTNITLGSFLRNHRESNNKSLQDMVNKIEISRMYLSEIERDEKIPSDKVLKRISKTYNLDEIFLFELIGRVPLSTKDELSEHLEVQRLLAKAQDLNITPELKRDMYSEIVDVFKRYLNT